MQTLLKIRKWESSAPIPSNAIQTVESAYKNQQPYLTDSKICCLCGTSSNIISM